MRFARWCWLWLLWPTLAAEDLPPAQYGPRVTVALTAQPLSAVLEDVGRQLNSRFTGELMRDKERLQQRVDLNLTNATARQALDALETLTGQNLRRVSRFWYQAETQDLYNRKLGLPLGDWSLWLCYVRYYFNSYLYFGDPVYRGAYGRLLPSFRLEAPSDIDSLLVRQLDPPSAVADGEVTLRSTGDRPTSEPDRRDNSVWTQTEYLTAPPPDARELTELGLDVQLARAVKVHRFVFDHWDQKLARLQTVGDYDAALELRGNVALVTTTGPPPAVVPENRAAQLLRNDRWIDGRLYAADRTPLFTSIRVLTSTVSDGVWTAQWQFQVLSPDSPKEVSELEVKLCVPEGEGPQVHLAFEHIPLPERSVEAPFAP